MGDEIKTTDLATRYADQPPEGMNRDVWRGACALAADRHPNACWPQPQDVRDAMTVILATMTQTTDEERIRAEERERCAGAKLKDDPPHD